MRKKVKVQARSPKKRYLIASVLIHASLLILLLLHRGGSSDSDSDGKGKGGRDVNIVDKPTEIELVSSSSAKERGPMLQRPLMPDCKHGSFGGIGIYFDPFSGKIDRVFSGYSADRAGILPDDEVVSPGFMDIKGDPGTYIEMVIYRSSTDQTIRLTVVRDKICTEPIKNE